ncbi:asparagine synthase (glutamine-hydrolyzing) [Desulfoluna spongiiphila]|uniref:asparagine synthase (glutamine-hydrolyzing) n=1 Tax=Desulfoluna spongiiphila TaxID=419481 RepID=A0A1G5JPW6_9BACT|nr:asparagine synthase (glutamine-hydrolyzing) [Desulfoluna spongiiphila]SCY90386.1 asparagine synthase (glutamine-hydrolysing) [Desulfoluna spongiiphila]
MCGIAGVVSRGSNCLRGLLVGSRDSMYHRGPDDSGEWWSADGRVGLGHRRLSVLDLSSGGRQPMSSADDRYHIVYNGEIYNFRELRITLMKLGYCFKSNSDTEVVLYSYQEWGDDCLQKFNGMFALAIYDSGDDNTASSIFFARDRVGKKPFYYKLSQYQFQFASELKGLNVNGSVDVQALNHYLSMGYIPNDLCISEGVKKLPPAHAGRLDLKTMGLRTWKYWSLPENKASQLNDGEELADQLEALLLDSVKQRLVSDVPLGVLLSGGLDSSLIVAAAAQQISGRLKTFTFAQPGSHLDESGYALCVGNHFGTDHHVVEMGTPSMAIIEELAPYVDEPLADSSIIPTFMVSRLTRQHVTVALGGDGGDELFGGYSDYSRALVDQKLIGWVPSYLVGMAAKMAALLPAGVCGRNRISSLRGGALQQMVWGSPYFDLVLRSRLLKESHVAKLGDGFDAPERCLRGLFNGGRDAVDSMTRAHFGSILPDDFLVKVDRQSMANSLEMRTPFLDYRLVEFAFSKIPSQWKVRGRETRRIQQLLAKRMLPSALDTNRKQGFSIPLDNWLRADRCRKVMDYIPYLPDCIQRREVTMLIDGEMKGRANGSRLFSLLMLGIAMKNNGANSYGN